MRAVVQRVLDASVHVMQADRSQKLTAEIGFGLVILIGVSNNDGVEQASSLADKIATLRVFEDEAGRMNRSLIDVRGSALVISNFTLYGDCRKGRRPSFTDAASGPTAEASYRAFGEALAAHGVPVGYGVFGAEMRLRLTNDGPVTLLIDTSKTF